jgi:hypothetical protein
MPYRYTEQDLADIRARQDANLAKFQQNSGRGLPAETVKAMENADGLKRDHHGAPVPEKIRPAKKAKVARRARTPQLPVPLEYEECRWLMDWAQTQRFAGGLVSDYLIHVPNGAYLGADKKTRGITMGKLKAMGTQPGASDYILPVPIWATKCPGLWLEMKRTRGPGASDDQKTFHERMLALGWRCEVANGWEAAALIITAYLRSYVPR